MATLDLISVGKSFAAVNILNDINLRVEDGNFVVLVGPSGCGKSTLLRMICGLENVTEGEVRIDDRRVNELAPSDRDIAMVLQSYALYPNLTVARNMAFPLEMRRAKFDEIKLKVDHAAKFLGLSELLDRRPQQLSGGQRQRVAMGRAIVRNPNVFLFDEPLSNLDAKMRVQMRAEIKELHQKLGTTTIYVTHDQIEAMTMADVVVLMNGGRIEQAGPPLQLYDFPANRFVAGFIGSPGMNFLDGQLDLETGIVDLGHNTKIAALQPSDQGGRHPITLGFRPEHVQFGSASVEGALRVEARVVEPTGAMTQVVVSWQGADLDIVTPDRIEQKLGDAAYVQLIPSHLHFFDRETGSRLSNLDGLRR